MAINVAYCIAAVSTTAFVALWFWVARRELRVKQSMMESAELQLVVIREQYAQSPADPDTSVVLKRSHDIYRQSLERYNEILCKPWIYLPGMLMGFHKAEDNYTAVK